MSTELPRYEFGKCPLSDAEGLCRSDGECPYGCDAEASAFFAERAARDRERMKVDRVFVLYRLLVTTGWVRSFQALNAPPELLARNKSLLGEVLPFVTPWVQAEFDRHWTTFWAVFSDPERRDQLFHRMETDLYHLYHPEHLTGPRS